jgi:hypothetical protein
MGTPPHEAHPSVGDLLAASVAAERGQLSTALTETTRAVQACLSRAFTATTVAQLDATPEPQPAPNPHTVEGLGGNTPAPLSTSRVGA